MQQAANPIIEISGLRKVFQTKQGDFTALDGIDLSINAGDIFGIIGLSGAGKSTLVRCINYLEPPTEGSIRFDGRVLGTLKPAELRRGAPVDGDDFSTIQSADAADGVGQYLSANGDCGRVPQTGCRAGR